MDFRIPSSPRVYAPEKHHLSPSCIQSTKGQTELPLSLISDAVGFPWNSFLFQKTQLVICH